MKSSISLSCYKTKSDALLGESDYGSRVISIGTTSTMYIKEPLFEWCPKGVKNGDVLSGNITYIKKNNGTCATSLGGVDKPNGYPLYYHVLDCAGDSSSSTSNNKKNDVEPIESAQEKLNSIVREAKIKHVKGLVNTNTFEEIYSMVVVEYPENIQLKGIRLSHYKKKLDGLSATTVGTTTTTERDEVIDKCVSAISDIIASIDASELAKSYGVLLPIVSKEVDEKKSVLVAAYTVKAKILLDRSVVDSDSGTGLEEYEETIKELQKWADVTKDAYWLLDYTKNKLKKR
jgi:hypothetical protein